VSHHSPPTPGGGRLLAIGDIHGCRTQLQNLLSLVAPTAHDQLVFLGDYVDRGPDSAGVIEELLALRGQLPRTIFLRGNHEQMLLEVLDGGDPTIFVYNGGGRTIASYQALDRWPPPPSHQEFLRTLPTSYATGEFIFVHAGLRPGIAETDQHPDDLLWIRASFLDSSYDWGKTVVFGHTPFAQALLEKQRIGLDTGCVYGGRLTCCDVLTRRCWQSG